MDLIGIKYGEEEDAVLFSILGRGGECYGIAVHKEILNMIGIGERAGSGVPDIYSVWVNQGWIAPKVIEEYAPDRTILKLLFVNAGLKKAAIKK